MDGRLALHLLFATALGVGLVGAARADGGDDPSAARKACEARHEAGNRAQLEQCCNDQILVEPMAKQHRLVAQCVSGSRSASSAKKPKAAAGTQASATKGTP